MLEVGNGVDFNCSLNAAALERCRAHFTMWTIMKAPLILGNDIPKMSAATRSVLANAEAIAVNQDALGIQARRVAVAKPSNSTLTADVKVNLAVVAVCDASRPTQAWRWMNETSATKNKLFMMPCNSADATQVWSFAGGVLRNAGAGACVDAAGSTDPATVLPCAPGSTSQEWMLQPSGHIATPRGNCLDVFNFVGPDVFLGGCKAPSDPSISNQVFSPPDAAGLVRSHDTGAPPNSCLAVSGGPPGGVLKTADAAGAEWCLVNRGSNEGTWGGEPCAARSRGGSFAPVANGDGVFDIGKSNFNNQVGASGPWPHTRYVAGGFSWSAPSFRWRANFSAPASPIVADDTTGIIDDDLVGGVTVGGAFCLQLTTGGMLEVWAGALSGGRVAVALFNRSPADDVIAVRWADVGLAAGARVAARDIWASSDLGVFSADFTRPVTAHAAVYLVLTPA